MTRTQPPPHRPILSTPPEVLRMIAKLLPSASTVALSLTRKPLHQNVERPVLAERTDDSTPYEEHDFLELLARDFEDYIACFYCAKLHTVTAAGFPKSSNLPRRECGTAAAQSVVKLGRGSWFPHLQMAMKQHHNGKSPAPYLEMLADYTLKSESNTSSISYGLKQARICDNEVIHRTQVWILIPSSLISKHQNTDLVVDADEDHDVYELLDAYDHFGICHHDAWPTDVWNRYSYMVLRVLQGLKTASCAGCAVSHQCRDCDQELRLDVKDYGTRGVALVASVWTNLGAASSPVDPKWCVLDQWIPDIERSVQEGPCLKRFKGCESDRFTPSLSAAQEKDFLDFFDMVAKEREAGPKVQ